MKDLTEGHLGPVTFDRYEEIIKWIRKWIRKGLNGGNLC
jgi:hypothetical protein